MKLNPECIRNILLYIEEQPVGSEIMITEALPPPLSHYAYPGLKAHVEQCARAGFLYGYKLNILGEIKLSGLSPSGYKFLDDIRPDTVWEKTKSTASKVGSFSLDFLAKVAANVTAELIKRHIN